MECGQEWKIKEGHLIYQYEIDFERWSSIIEDEANKVAKESGRKKRKSGSKFLKLRKKLLT
jgi:hypothetical protein